MSKIIQNVSASILALFIAFNPLLADFQGKGCGPRLNGVSTFSEEALAARAAPFFELAYSRRVSLIAVSLAAAAIHISPQGDLHLAIPSIGEILQGIVSGWTLMPPTMAVVHPVLSETHPENYPWKVPPEFLREFYQNHRSGSHGTVIEFGQELRVWCESQGYDRYPHSISMTLIRWHHLYRDTFRRYDGLKKDRAVAVRRVGQRDFKVLKPHDIVITNLKDEVNIIIWDGPPLEKLVAPDSKIEVLLPEPRKSTGPDSIRPLARRSDHEIGDQFRLLLVPMMKSVEGFLNSRPNEWVKLTEIVTGLKLEYWKIFDIYLAAHQLFVEGRILQQEDVHNLADNAYKSALCRAA